MPECQKLEDNQELISNVLEFIEYAKTKKVSLTKVNEYTEERPKNMLGSDDETYTHSEKFHDLVDAEKLLYEMLDVNPVELEKERQALIASL